MSTPKSCRRCSRQVISPSVPRAQRPPGALVMTARQLCGYCWRQAQATGTLIDFERLVRSRDDVLDDWDELRRHGYTRERAAEKMGMTLAALDRAITRARKDGDPRAQLGVKR